MGRLLYRLYAMYMAVLSAEKESGSCGTSSRRCGPLGFYENAQTPYRRETRLPLGAARHGNTPDSGISNAAGAASGLASKLAMGGHIHCGARAVS